VIAVQGDLRAPRFGLGEQAYRRLAGEIEMIIHAGAQVHYLYPYGALKPANVHGTIEVLRLACESRIKPVHYISSIAVAESHEGSVAYESDPLPACTSGRGYNQSKWVAESLVRLARERGVPTTIYRPGRIGPHSRSGVSNPEDFFGHLLAACLSVGAAPDIPLVENLIPVDFAAQAIVELAGRAASIGQTYHLTNPQSTDWRTVVAHLQQAGYALDLLPYTRWREVLANAASEGNAALYGMLSLAPEDEAEATWIDYLARHSFDARLAEHALASRGLHCPPIDGPYLERMVVDSVQRGLLTLPETTLS
jgi:thioester reductase-like protein